MAMPCACSSSVEGRRGRWRGWRPFSGCRRRGRRDGLLAPARRLPCAPSATSWSARRSPASFTPTEVRPRADGHTSCDRAAGVADHQAALQHQLPWLGASARPRSSSRCAACSPIASTGCATVVRRGRKTSAHGKSSMQATEMSAGQDSPCRGWRAWRRPPSGCWPRTARSGDRACVSNCMAAR